MEWIIAGGVSWFFGHLGLFIVLTLLAFAFPRTMAVAMWLILIPVVWGGSSIILGFVGALCGFLPADPSAFWIAAMITAIPSFICVSRLSGDVWSIGRGR